jgi:hypothetical protein
MYTGYRIKLVYLEMLTEIRYLDQWIIKDYGKVVFGIMEYLMVNGLAK